MSVFEELDATVIKPAPGSRAMLGVVASVVFPGLGHLIVGRKKRAAVFFVIDAVIIVATIWLLSLGTIGLLQLLVQPRWVRAVVVGNVALGLFRLIAAADLVALERPKVNRFLTAGMAAVLTVVLVGPHMFVMTRALSLLDVLENVFPAEGHIAAAFERHQTQAEADRAAGSVGPNTTITGTTAPQQFPDAPDGTVVPHFGDAGDPRLEPIDLNRVTVLLAGGDAGPGRSGLRTDTMIVASLDVETGEGVLITISRELTGFSMPTKLQNLQTVVTRQELVWAAAQKAELEGYTKATDLLPLERDEALWLDRINAIYPFTYGATGTYPDEARPGMAALRDTVSRTLGIHIDYYVLVDFAGFVDLVDAIGGVRITSRETMDIRMSPAKEGEEDLILHITPGRHTLDGRSALVYVRNRTDTSDLVRTRRQRCFVREVVGQVSPSTVVLNFDRIARAISRYARTDIPLLILPDLIQVVADVEKTDIATMAIQPGYLADTINYRGLPVLNIDRTRAAVRDVMSGLGSGDVGLNSECGS